MQAWHIPAPRPFILLPLNRGEPVLPSQFPGRVPATLLSYQRPKMALLGVEHDRRDVFVRRITKRHNLVQFTRGTLLRSGLDTDTVDPQDRREISVRTYGYDRGRFHRLPCTLKRTTGRLFLHIVVLFNLSFSDRPAGISRVCLENLGRCP